MLGKIKLKARYSIVAAFKDAIQLNIEPCAGVIALKHFVWISTGEPARDARAGVRPASWCYNMAHYWRILQDWDHSFLFLFNIAGVNISGASNWTSKIFIFLNIAFLVILFKGIRKASTKSFNPIWSTNRAATWQVGLTHLAFVKL